MAIDFLDYIPLWAAFCVTVLIVMAATELGFWAGLRHSRKTHEDNDSQISSTTGAHLGLLAFILAFSFSMAAENFGDRKKAALADINAIETTFLRATLVAEPQGENIRNLLREYTALRMQANAPGKVQEILDRSTKIQANIWTQVEQLVNQKPVTVTDGLLVQAVNEVFDRHEERVFAGVRNRMPGIIWAALYTVLMLSMLGVGFHFGTKGSRSTVPSLALALSFSMVLFLIADLDRPSSGLMLTDQIGMVELHERMMKQ